MKKQLRFSVGVKYQFKGQPSPPCVFKGVQQPHSSSVSLQYDACLRASPSLPPTKRWCPGAALTWRVLQSAPPCRFWSGWVGSRSWPGRMRCRLAGMCWSSPISGSRPTIRVWPHRLWASSRPQRRSVSKVIVLSCLSVSPWAPFYLTVKVNLHCSKD